jgi:hypothetical protein
MHLFIDRKLGSRTCFFLRNNTGLKKLYQVSSEQISDPSAFINDACLFFKVCTQL